MYDVIIIGGGPAGLTSAIYSSRAGLDTLLIEKKFPGGQMATTSQMENYPGFKEPISGAELAMHMEDQAKHFGVKIIYEDVIDTVLDTVTKTIKTSNALYQCKAVILCMGAYPRLLGLPGEKRLTGSGVSYCATCDGAFFKNMTVAVVGGGDTAAEDALYLSRFCSKVYLIHRRDTLRAAKVLQNAMFTNSKVEFIWNSVIEDIYGKFSVEGLQLRNLRTDEVFDVQVDGLFVAVGNIPSTNLVKGKVELNQWGYIVTDENMQTNIFGVFAAGDIREKPLRQVITAASDGATAAYSAERYISDNTW
ncbi:MAG: thioredoxin-disulfide reductase [Clostridia bacterium]|nr:thioredoxin-disulfide reductase [Clostridia bacterium]